jgi:hypothetical protein
MYDNDGLIPEPPIIVTHVAPDGTVERQVIERWRIVRATSFDREAHTPVRPIRLS